LTLPVFLSASEPYEGRPREFRDSQNLVNIRAAVRAICAHVLRQGPLVFGGHPAITPLARGIADRIRNDTQRKDPKAAAPRLLMFQSRLYVSKESPDVALIDAHDADGRIASKVGWRNMSLLRMRYEMLGYKNAAPLQPKLKSFQFELGERRRKQLGTTDFRAAFFVGGMEGVISEFHIFRSFHPQTPAYPLASTGAAARVLLDGAGISNANLKTALEKDTAYSLLLEQLLDPPKETESVYRWQINREAAPYSVDQHMDPERLDREIPLPP
jgi:hypothetical protein